MLKGWRGVCNAREEREEGIKLGRQSRQAMPRRRVARKPAIIQAHQEGIVIERQEGRCDVRGGELLQKVKRTLASRYRQL